MFKTGKLKLFEGSSVVSWTAVLLSPLYLGNVSLVWDMDTSCMHRRLWGNMVRWIMPFQEGHLESGG